MVKSRKMFFNLNSRDVFFFHTFWGKKFSLSIFYWQNSKKNSENNIFIWMHFVSIKNVYFINCSGADVASGGGLFFKLTNLCFLK